MKALKSIKFFILYIVGAVSNSIFETFAKHIGTFLASDLELSALFQANKDGCS